MDRQIILLYLEGETASEIADVTGLSPSNIATKIHRIRNCSNRGTVRAKVMNGAPQSVWKSINGKEEANMDITFTPDQLRAMAHSRERESIWSRRILIVLLIGLTGAFAYNVVSISQLWPRLAQAWMLAWTCLLLWRFRRTPRRMSVTENCASFLRRELEGKRSGLLAIRRYMFLLIPPIFASWWAGAVTRLKFASGPWPFIIIGLLLILVWLAFVLAAKKAAREIDELRRRTQ